MDSKLSSDSSLSAPQHWIEILVGVGSIATVLLPVTGLITFQAPHIALRSLPGELVGGMPITELAANGFSPTLYALLISALAYFAARSLQQLNASTAEIQSSRESASAAGVSDESLATLTRDLNAIKERSEDLDIQRRALTAGLAANTVTAAQARAKSADVETRAAEIDRDFEAIGVRVEHVEAAAKKMYEQIQAADSKVHQLRLMRILDPLSPLLLRMPTKIVRILPILTDLVAFGVLLLIFPFGHALTVVVVILITQWFTARQGREREPLRIVRIIPVVATVLVITSVGFGLTSGPMRLADAVFDQATGLSPATVGYLGATGEARYLLDCSGIDRVLVVPNDRVTLTLHPRPVDASPTLISWLKDTSQPLLPFIGPTCGSQGNP